MYNDNYPQFWASSVPLATSLYLITKKSFVSSVISRSGNTSEVLKGPLLYTFILSIMTLYYWTDNPIGLITMSQLSFGDGFADLVGRRYGKTKGIYNKMTSH